MKARRWAALALLLSSPSGTLAGAQTEGGVECSPARSRIAFVRDMGRNDFDLFTVRPDGKGLKRLTRNRVDDWGPAWSPDGTRIAFGSHRSGNGEIYVMDRNGSNVTRLTFDEASDQLPAWSPDGEWLAFSSTREDGVDDDLYLMPSTGGEATQLTNSPHNEWNASWSPSGRRIVFERNDSIFSIKRDGTGLRRLTRRGVASNPVWSNGGRLIAFQMDFVDRSGMDVFVMRRDGSNRRVLLRNRFDEQTPTWSPNDRSIAYSHNFRVAVARADGTRRRVLFDHDKADYKLDWGNPVVCPDPA